MVLTVLLSLAVLGVGMAQETLREAGKKAGIFVGAASNAFHLANASDPMYKKVLAEQYSLVTAENSCKFGPTEPSRGNYTFGGCDAVLDAVEEADGVMRLHNMVWTNYNPNWLEKGGWNASELIEIEANHIKAVLGRYSSRSSVIAVDVVNEAVSDGGEGAPMFKDCVWFPKVEDYVKRAFSVARGVAGSTKLFYNDYGAEEVNAKSDRIYKLLSETLHGLVDGMGFQFHISTSSPPDIASVKQNFARFAALDIDIHITELDIRCEPAPCDAAGLEKEAKIYASVLQACLDEPRCKSFETWGFTDRYTWLWDFNNPSHVNLMPLPFDINYNPKPAFHALLQTMQNAT